VTGYVTQPRMETMKRPRKKIAYMRWSEMFGYETNYFNTKKEAIDYHESRLYRIGFKIVKVEINPKRIEN